MVKFYFNFNNLFLQDWCNAQVSNFFHTVYLSLYYCRLLIYFTCSYHNLISAIEVVGTPATLEDPLSIPQCVTPDPWNTDRITLTQLEIARSTSPTTCPGIVPFLLLVLAFMCFRC